MIETKLLEIRDRGTFIPVAAFRCQSKDVYGNVLGSAMRLENEAEHYLLRRAGFARNATQVMVVRLVDSQAACDPHEWSSGSRTMTVAHEHIEKNWESLASGSVVCVEHILGERATPKVSERTTK